MDPRLFAPGAPGRLVRTATRKGPDNGFVPDPLPAAWEMPAKTRALAARAHAALERLRRAGATARFPALAVSFLQLREARHSSATGRERRSTWRGAFRYRRVLERAHAALEGERPIRLRELVQEIHAGLFEGRPRRSVFPGRLRRGFIQMGDAARYVPPPYAYVVPCLAALERWVARDSAIDELARCFMVKYQFVTIHPFADGNGRVGRILLSAMLNRRLMPAAPLAHLGAFFAANRRQYFDRLFRVNTHGDWAPWIDFCLHGTAAAADHALRVLASLEALAQRHARDLGEALAGELLATPAFTKPQLAALCARHGRNAEQVLEGFRRGGTPVRAEVNGYFSLVEPAKLLA